MTLAAWFVAFLLDNWLGDPPRWPHPVRWIGNLITGLQRRIRAVCHSELALKWGGALLWVLVVGITWLVSWGFLWLMTEINPWLGWLAQVWMIYTLLAGRCLSDAALLVFDALQQGSLAQSREKLSWIVGRDTSQLETPQMTRAVVETVAENSVDGVIAPLFFLLLGARRWQWPTKRSIPLIRWWAIKRRNTARWVMSPPEWMIGPIGFPRA